MTRLSDEFQRSWVTSIIGIILFLVGVWLLTWNEGRAIHHANSLDEAYNNVISLNPYEPLKPELDGHLVHVNGPLVIDEPLTEPDYGISVQAVKLKRRVQMFQWVEERTSRDFGDSTSGQNSDVIDYYYITEWRDKLVDSGSFYIRHGHQNPREMPLKTHIYVAPSVRIGQLIVSHRIKNKFNDFVEVTSDERPETRNIKLHLGIYYHCDDVWNPEVGDIRVQFYYAGVGEEVITLIAKQKNGVLVPYVTSKGHEIALVRHGLLNINQMFIAERSEAKIETWKIRGGGIFLLYASVICLAKLLRIMFCNVPIIRNMVSNEATTSNLTISLSVSLIVIATAWIFYRPLLGAGLLLAAFSPFFYCTLGIYNTVQTQNSVYIR